MALLPDPRQAYPRASFGATLSRASIGSRHVSLREAITRELRERILTQVLVPGQRLVERELSAELEVSRIPLREAIVQLETEGLVRVVPRRGAFVAAFSRKDLEDFFAIRQALEPLAARLSAERAGPSDIERMYRYLNDELAALERRDTDAVQLANDELHGLIAETADSAVLTMAMRPLRTRLRWQDTLQRALDLRQIYHEHQRLVEAIAAHDRDAAAAISLQHVLANEYATGAVFEQLEVITGVSCSADGSP